MLLNRRFAHTYLAPFIIAIATAVPAVAQTTAAAPAQAVRAVQPRIDNFGRINANYYRGAQPEGQDYKDLAALGVKTVINLTSFDAVADEKQMSEQAGMTYVNIPMTVHEPPTAAQMAQFLSIVNDPASQPVYVHCVGGRHRTGVMTAVYRMSNDAWTGEQAFKEMKQYKFGADMLHSEFKAFVVKGFHPDALMASAAASTTDRANGANGATAVQMKNDNDKN